MTEEPRCLGVGRSPVAWVGSLEETCPEREKGVDTEAEGTVGVEVLRRPAGRPGPVGCGVAGEGCPGQWGRGLFGETSPVSPTPDGRRG